MGDRDRAFARLADDVRDLALKQGPGLEIQGRKRLVQQDRIGIERQRPHEGYPPTHSPRQRAGTGLLDHSARVPDLPALMITSRKRLPSRHERVEGHQGRHAAVEPVRLPSRRPARLACPSVMPATNHSALAQDTKIEHHTLEV